MTVVLNNAAIETFFTEPNGEVARLMAIKSIPVISAMRKDVHDYFVRAEFGIEDDVALEMQGTTAIVKLRNDPEGRSTHRVSKSARYSRIGEFRETKESIGL